MNVLVRWDQLVPGDMIRAENAAYERRLLTVVRVERMRGGLPSDSLYVNVLTIEPGTWPCTKARQEYGGRTALLEVVMPGPREQAP